MGADSQGVFTAGFEAGGGCDFRAIGQHTRKWVALGEHKRPAVFVERAMPGVRAAGLKMGRVVGTDLERELFNGMDLAGETIGDAPAALAEQRPPAFWSRHGRGGKLQRRLAARTLEGFAQVKHGNTDDGVTFGALDLLGRRGHDAFRVAMGALRAFGRLRFRHAEVLRTVWAPENDVGHFRILVGDCSNSRGIVTSASCVARNHCM